MCFQIIYISDAFRCANNTSLFFLQSLGITAFLSFFFFSPVCIKTLHVYQRVLTSAHSQGWLNGQSMDKSTWQIHFTIWHSWHSLLKFSSQINLYGNCIDAECRSVRIASSCPGNDFSYGWWWCTNFCISLSDKSRCEGPFAEYFARACALVVGIFVVFQTLIFPSLVIGLWILAGSNWQLLELSFIAIIIGFIIIINIFLISVIKLGEKSFPEQWIYEN